MSFSPSPSSASSVSTPSKTSLRKQVVYLVRHAEATHNIKEREAVKAALDQGIQDTDTARRAVLQDESLLDAPLSDDGLSQVLRASERLNLLDRTKYPPPKLVLVSPLRRVLMTATELFLDNPQQDGAASDLPPPRFVAMEALREKRTGYAADERMPVEVLEQEFPHVDFSNLKGDHLVVRKGETNVQVRQRGKDFLEGYFANNVPEDSIAVVTHKGWLREMRKTIKELVDNQQLQVHFDLDKWYQTLYGNAEIRVADFGWKTTTNGTNQLVSIVSKSVENAALEGCDSEDEQQQQQQQQGGGECDNNLQKEEQDTVVVGSMIGKQEKNEVGSKPNNLLDFFKAASLGLRP